MRRLALVLAGAALLAGCAQQDAPPKLTVGRDVCAECSMILSDERFSAAVTLEDGQALKFDDLGCLARWMKTGGRQAARVWVVDHDTLERLDGTRASYVRNSALRSPMGHGIAAYAARREGAVDWKSLIEEGI